MSYFRRNDVHEHKFGVWLLPANTRRPAINKKPLTTTEACMLAYWRDFIPFGDYMLPSKLGPDLNKMRFINGGLL